MGSTLDLINLAVSLWWRTGHSCGYFWHNVKTSYELSLSHDNTNHGLVLVGK